MKKLLFALVFVFAFGAGVEDAQAANATYEVGYASYAVVGVKCSTDSITNLTSTLPTGWNARIAGYRIQNQDLNDTDKVWLGGVSVDSITATGFISANLGVAVKPGVSVPYNLGKDVGNLSRPQLHVYCLAADAAGADGVKMSVEFFGY